MSDFTIIIPVYNEEANLLRVEKELLEYLEIASLTTSILFVNDGSNDGSQQIIETICQRNKDFHFILFHENKGLSAALKAGFDWTKSNWIGYIDSDLQTNPKDFELLLKHRDQYELITGIRTNRQDGIIKRFSSRVANSFRRLFTQDGMTDTGCPLKVIKTEYAKRIPMFKGLHRFLPAMILLQEGRVYQVPVRHFPRMGGKGKFGLWNRTLGPFIDCFAYLWMKQNYIHYTIKKSS